jgi:hypothetical protein
LNGYAALITFDVLGAVKSDLAEGQSYSTFGLESVDLGIYGAIYSSLQDPHGPRIVAEGDFASPVPLPGAVWLLGTGLLGLCLLRGRRK